eukprot:Skav225160  [mRNA]  locus=scaffold1056:322744:323601:- [translate_table: standard]
MSRHIARAGLDWEYLNEGGANMVLRYTGDCSEFCGSVLRLRKGFTNQEARRQIEEDFHFQGLVLQPILGDYLKTGCVVEVDAEMNAFINSAAIQSARPAARTKGAAATFVGDVGAVPAMLCTDLSFCPNGRSFEIKPKVGIADCGVPECGIPDVPRFTMLQCIDYPTKKKSLSKYNPVRFFRAVLHQVKQQLREELEFLRDASRDVRQNNFRLLGCEAHEACLVPDTALDDLAEAGPSVESS